MKAMYGHQSATIHLNGLPGDPTYGRTCSVHLDKDPGHGSMNFYNESTTQITITEATPEEYRAVAAQLRNAAKYLSVDGFATRERYLELAERYELESYGEPDEFGNFDCPDCHPHDDTDCTCDRCDGTGYVSDPRP